jgi:excisionase family DNA binding protein
MTAVLTTEQLAKKMHLSPRKIRQLVRQGALPALPFSRVLRFSEAAVEEALRRASDTESRSSAR